MESPNQIIDALIAERADFGPPGAAAGIAMIAESKFPGKLKVFGLQGGGIAVNRINDALIVKPDSTIKAFADLKGKTLGHVPGIQWRTISRHMVRAAGLDPDKDVKLVDLAVAMQVPAVVGGTVDATLSLEPVGSIAVASGKAIRAMTNPWRASSPTRSIRAPHHDQQVPQGAPRSRQARGRRDRRGHRPGQCGFREIQGRDSELHADQAGSARLLAQPYLRGFKDLNDTDIKSYQALVDIFIKEGVLAGPLDVREKLLTMAELGM